MPLTTTNQQPGNLVPIEPRAYTHYSVVYEVRDGKRTKRYGYKREYTYEYEWLPSYWTMKRYLREYLPTLHEELKLKAKALGKKEGGFKGRIEVHRYGRDMYTYQYIPRDKPPKCMIIIDPKAKKFYTTEQELQRLIKDYSLRSRDEAVRMCQVQATAFLSLLKALKDVQETELKIKGFPESWIRKRVRKRIERVYL